MQSVPRGNHLPDVFLFDHTRDDLSLRFRCGTRDVLSESDRSDSRRNGFVSNTRHEVAAKLKGLQINACPFANLPERKRTQWALTRKEMKNCVWVKPEMVVQIEFGEWTPDGHLRHSKFVALRDDKDVRKVVRET